MTVLAALSEKVSLKGRALQRCQSFFGRLVLLCQRGHLTHERRKFEWI